MRGLIQLKFQQNYNKKLIHITKHILEKTRYNETKASLRCILCHLARRWIRPILQLPAYAEGIKMNKKAWVIIDTV